MPWAILLGALASALSLRLPGPLAQTVGLLADAASPVALFTIGAVLARSRMQVAKGQTQALRLRDYLPVACLKLFLHPLLVFLVGAYAIRIGVPLDRSALQVMVLVAALPSNAANLYVVLSARGIAPRCRLIARSDSDEAARKLRLAGADQVVSPYVAGGRSMAATALRPLAAGTCT